MKLLTVSRLQERKNHFRMVNAVMRLVQSGWIPDLEYDIVGDGDLREALRTHIELHGFSERIRMYPYVPDRELIEFYESCDVFILASKTLPGDVEGFGIVYLEAGLFGKPVIAGDKGGAIDAVEHNVNGLLVDAESEEAIARAILFLYKYPGVRKEFGFRNKEFAESHAWEVQAGKVEEVLKECVS